MTTTKPRSNTGTETTVALVAASSALAIGGTVWAGAALAAVATGHAVPAFTPGAVIAAVTHPAEPGTAWAKSMPSPLLVWATTAVVALVAALLGWAGWRLLGWQSAPAVYRLPGTASRSQTHRAASATVLRKRGRHLRPSLNRPVPEDIGHQIGRARGVNVWTSCEDSIIILGPTRSGKGLHVVVDMILDAPGAVVTTSTRPDNLAVTLNARARTGPVAVFDPQQLADGIGSGARWSPVRGCDQPRTAMIRATGLASATGMHGSNVDNASYWQGQTEAVLRGLLHAAALDGRDARDLYRWSLDPVRAEEAVRVMQNNADAAAGWADALDAVIGMDERTRSNIWSGVRQALSALADPRVLDAVTSQRGEQFEPHEFITAGGTLYLLGTKDGAGASAALVNALIEDVVDAARRIAAASPNARLDPPLSLVLDEIGNLAPVPSLPSLMAEGGGSGLTTTAVLQSRAQARRTWGENDAATIWDAATTKVILGGGSEAKDLQDLSSLIGERDDETLSTSRNHDGTRSTSTSLRRIPIMDPGQLRTLPFGTGVLMLRSAPPIILTMKPWTGRPDADSLVRDRQEMEQRMMSSAQHDRTA